MKMNADQFMNLSIKEKLKTVNKMLDMEDKDHLKNVSAKVGMPYSAFTKVMRDNGNYQYNQTSKKYEKLMSLEDYEKYLQLDQKRNVSSSETLDYLEEHLDEIKKLLKEYQDQLILDPSVYHTSSKTVSKSLQVNEDIYNQFTKLCSTHFPHFRQKDIVSQSLLDFVQKYQKTPFD